jgi:hypothetical protein
VDRLEDARRSGQIICKKMKDIDCNIYLTTTPTRYLTPDRLSEYKAFLQ